MESQTCIRIGIKIMLIHSIGMNYLWLTMVYEYGAYSVTNIELMRYRTLLTYAVATYCMLERPARLGFDDYKVRTMV
jgi:hypothetical protein